MTFCEILEDFRKGNPVRRESWSVGLHVFHDNDLNTFCEADGTEWVVQCKYSSLSMEDLVADDWEACDWDGEYCMVTA
jgi:hypothetical protein